MVYKYFVKKKNGKIFGPYYYKSYRVGNKVNKEYLGKNYEKIPRRPSWWGIFNTIIKMRFNGDRSS